MGRTMFFLLRLAFFLGLVILLVPADQTEVKTGGRLISSTDMIVAASQALDDAKGFCERQPAACEVGHAFGDTYSAKARTAARMIYDYLDPTAGPRTTGTVFRGRNGLPFPPPAKPPVPRETDGHAT